MKYKFLLAALIGAALTSGAQASTKSYYEREAFDESFEGFNNTLATAENIGTLWGGNTLSIVGSHALKSYGGTSADYYKFTLGVSTTLTALIEAWKPTNQSTVTGSFTLLGSTGNSLASGTSLTEELTAGTYYVRIASNAASSYNYTISASAAATPVPEADMASLALLGFGAAGFVARRRKRA